MLTIKSRFVLFLSIFASLLACSLAVISVFWISRSFSIIEHAPDPSLIPVMASRMFAKFIWGYVIAVVLSALVSIPIGVLLFRSVSKRYLHLLDELRVLAESRIALKGEPSRNTELSALEEYRRILSDDLDRLQEFEKIKGIQNGARMLIHELKNPLTPLKLNAQKLALRSDDRETARILTAASDIEQILRAFRDLVNIDFPAKKLVELTPFLADFSDEIGELYPSVLSIISPDLPVIESEPSLLKMILINLIKNCVEANPEHGEFRVRSSGSAVKFEIFTPNRTLAEPSRIFRPGISEKGEGRGYGLFICRQTAEYLSAELTAENCSDGVLFSLTCALP